MVWIGAAGNRQTYMLWLPLSLAAGILIWLAAFSFDRGEYGFIIVVFAMLATFIICSIWIGGYREVAGILAQTSFRAGPAHFGIYPMQLQSCLRHSDSFLMRIARWASGSHRLGSGYQYSRSRYGAAHFRRASLAISGFAGRSRTRRGHTGT